MLGVEEGSWGTWARAQSIDPTTLSRWMSEKYRQMPGVLALQTLAEALQVPWEWLLVGDDGVKELATWKENPKRWERLRQRSPQAAAQKSARS